MMETMIAGLLAIPGLRLYGISDPRRFENRCATFAVRIEGRTPLELATKLGERGFFTWDARLDSRGRLSLREMFLAEFLYRRSPSYQRQLCQSYE